MAAETIYLQTAGGVVVHDLPLHWAIQEQLDKGHIARVDEDGNPWSEQAEKPKPGPRAAKADTK